MHSRPASVKTVAATHPPKWEGPIPIRQISQRLSRSTDAADTDAESSDDDELVELVGVLPEHQIQPLGPKVKLGVVAEPEEDHAGVRPLQAKDQIAEVQIRGNEDAPLGVGDVEDSRIGEPMRVLLADPRGVMPTGV